MKKAIQDFREFMKIHNIASANLVLSHRRKDSAMNCPIDSYLDNYESYNKDWVVNGMHVSLPREAEPEIKEQEEEKPKKKSKTKRSLLSSRPSKQEEDA